MRLRSLRVQTDCVKSQIQADPRTFGLLGLRFGVRRAPDAAGPPRWIRASRSRRSEGGVRRCGSASGSSCPSPCPPPAAAAAAVPAPRPRLPGVSSSSIRSSVGGGAGRSWRCRSSAQLLPLSGAAQLGDAPAAAAAALRIRSHPGTASAANWKKELLNPLEK